MIGIVTFKIVENCYETKNIFFIFEGNRGGDRILIYKVGSSSLLQRELDKYKIKLEKLVVSPFVSNLQLYFKYNKVHFFLAFIYKNN